MQSLVKRQADFHQRCVENLNAILNADIPMEEKRDWNSYLQLLEDICNEKLNGEKRM